MIAVKDFGMFTDAGNKEIAVIVEHAKANSLTWPETYRLLNQIATCPGYGEAMDTEVREIVYSRLNFNTAFYF
jgi:hypothetical protein